MNIVEFKKPAPMPGDFPSILRDLAGSVEKGQVTEFVCAAVIDGNYEFLFPSSLADSLLLATLLQHRCITRMQV